MLVAVGALVAEPDNKGAQAAAMVRRRMHVELSG